MDKLVTSYIGLGGNVGDVFANMQSALRSLDTNEGVSVKAVSNVYKTPPWGIENQDWFLNACAKVETSLAPQALLDECLLAEKALNRIRDVRWGPRTIDLDVLIYGAEEIKTETLQVPHPRMHERGFVLLPMADIAPQLILKDKTISQWANAIETSDIQQTEFNLTL